MIRPDMHAIQIQTFVVSGITRIFCNDHQQSTGKIATNVWKNHVSHIHRFILKAQALENLLILVCAHILKALQ